LYPFEYTGRAQRTGERREIGAGGEKRAREVVGMGGRRMGKGAGQDCVPRIPFANFNIPALAL